MVTTESILAHFDDGDSLAHYGVKGMKWGVRKDRKKSNDPYNHLDTLKIKADGYSGKVTKYKFNKDAVEYLTEKKQNQSKQLSLGQTSDDMAEAIGKLPKILKKAEKQINFELKRLNRRPEYANMMSDPEYKQLDKYMGEVAKLVQDHVNAQSLIAADKNKRFVVNYDTGTSDISVTNNPNKEQFTRDQWLAKQFSRKTTERRFKRRVTQVYTAALIGYFGGPMLFQSDPNNAVRIYLKTDDDGFVVGIDRVEPFALKHEYVELGNHIVSSMMEDEALAHYGVKGMKWGVRRSQEALDRAAGRATKAKKKVNSYLGDKVAEIKKKRATAKKQRAVDKRKLKAFQRQEALEREKLKERAKTAELENKLARRIAEKNAPKKPKFAIGSDKRYRNISDEDLKKAVDRLDMEKRYDTLKLERAKRNAGPALKIAKWGGEVATDIASDVAKRQLKMLGNEIVGEAMFGGPDEYAKVFNRYKKK